MTITIDIHEYLELERAIAEEIGDPTLAALYAATIYPASQHAELTQALQRSPEAGPFTGGPGPVARSVDALEELLRVSQPSPVPDARGIAFRAAPFGLPHRSPTGRPVLFCELDAEPRFITVEP